jgi:hypothetical protein
MGAAMKRRPTIVKRSERGIGLIETMIALLLILIGLLAVMSLFTVASAGNTTQGEYQTRTTEFAQYKMEQLLQLSFSDSATNTTVFPPAPTGGTGLGSGLTPGGSVGSVNPASPVSGYVDYLGNGGDLLPSSSGWFYKRQWRIDLDATSRMKTITVLAIARNAAGPGVTPSSTLVCFKSNVP